MLLDRLLILPLQCPYFTGGIESPRVKVLRITASSRLEGLPKENMGINLVAIARAAITSPKLSFFRPPPQKTGAAFSCGIVRAVTATPASGGQL